MNSMKLKLLLMATFCCFVISASAQGRLEYEAISSTNYSAEGRQSAIIVQCDSTLPTLNFYSSLYGTMKPRVRTRAGETLYYLDFDLSTGPVKTDLNVTSAGFNPLVLSITLSEIKKAYLIKVFDPDGPFVQGYFRYRRQAEDYFKAANYEAARNEYETAKSSSNAKKEEVDMRIATIDSILSLKRAANDSIAAERYYAASNLFAQIIEMNSNDKNAAERQKWCNTKLDEICTTAMTTADRYYRNHQFYKAQPFYQQIIENNCANRQLAQSRFDEIEQIRYQRRVLPHVVGYIFDKDKPLGVHYGTYNERKGGGFINVRINKDLLDAAQKDWKPSYQQNDSTLNGIKNHAQFSIAFGWTIKLLCPNPETDYFKGLGCMIPKYPSLHLFFGPGYTGTMVYTDKEEKNSNVKYNTKLVSAITPQVGLMLKWGRLSMFYIFEYHYKLKNEIYVKENGVEKTIDLSDIDCVKKSKNYFGLGFAF